MKRNTIIFTIIYLLIFLVGGYFLYTLYLKPYFTPEPVTPKTSEQIDLYFSDGGKLNYVNTNEQQGSRKTTALKLASVGNIASFSLSRDKQYFFYEEVLTPQKSVIWKYNQTDNTSEKIFSALTPGLENFTSFKLPVLSPDNTKLAFVGQNPSGEYLYYYDFTDKSLTNLNASTPKTGVRQLAWSTNNASLYDTSFSTNKTVISSTNSQKVSEQVWEGTGETTELKATKDTLVFGLKNGQAINIFSLVPLTKKITQITDLTFPRTLGVFNIAPDQKSIVFEIKDASTSQSDIYYESLDGTNLIQITDDGKSSYPVISSDNGSILYFLKGSGLYKSNTNKTRKEKVLNYDGNINRIFTWR